jgi:hypothetical protein
MAGASRGMPELGDIPLAGLSAANLALPRP